jgi:uncharacterized membrane protein
VSPAPARLYLDAALAPRRSLSRRGFAILVIVFGAFSLALAGMFKIAGAPFVPIFLGLDALGLFIAFHLSYRGARQVERVRVSADEITVSRETPRSRRTVWTSATAFTRVELVEPDDHGARVSLHSKGRGLTLAAALSPKERVDFARELEAAVAAARAERW